MRAALLTIAMITMASATWGDAAAAEDSTLDQNARTVGRELGTAARAVGQEAKKVGKAVGEAAKEGAHAVKKGGQEFARAVKGETAQNKSK